MKKILLAIFCVTSFTAFSQDIKVKAGINVPDFKVEHKTPNEKIDLVDKNNVGFYLGVGYEYKLNEKFSLEAEIIYNKISYDWDMFPYDSERFNTLLVPITLNYYPIEKLNIGIGANANYLLKSEIELSYINAQNPEALLKGKEETTDFYHKLNYGLHFSASYNIWKGLFVEARYYVGVGKMNKKTDLEDRSYNNLQLGLSYKF